MVKEIKHNINAKGIGIRIISSDSEDENTKILMNQDLSFKTG